MCEITEEISDEKIEQIFDSIWEYDDIDNPTEEDTMKYRDNLMYFVESEDYLGLAKYGSLCHKLNRDDIAMKCYEKVIISDVDTEDPVLARTYVNMGCICKNEMGDYFAPEKAFSYFLISSFLGFIGGMYEVAMCYKEGFFVKKDMGKFYDLMKTMCDVADKNETGVLPEAYYELALKSYEENDYLKAKQLINKASKSLKCTKVKYLPDETVIEKIDLLKEKINSLTVAL